MKMKFTVVGLFLINILFGNLCMMSMAMAAEMPPSHDMNATEQVITPMEPMSHADCYGCPHHTEKKEPAQQSSSCAGHCLSQVTSANPANIDFGSSQLVAALPVSFPIVLNAPENAAPLPLVNTSPPSIPTDTVVLRL